ncbi:hypothetical protein [Natrialbaceae archaeon AArc-T1-2]|uniref:hypothetical protein n=1 Tax=Natrialbaceae archaeon AArc-T1-2 TaxID=3053904 RepID=UPI00255AAF2E|nr:hypothetical protein [Natrialbaceae archaeon AArc-T1-2]WIV67148.1 hypothetical protein QQ977_00010 [Natrialbaceae archaeon AArc-T1-2]
MLDTHVDPWTPSRTGPLFDVEIGDDRVVDFVATVDMQARTTVGTLVVRPDEPL